VSEELFGGVVPSGSPDFRSELAAKLAELMPEVVADGKVDVVKLQELLGSDAVDDKLERFGLFWPGKRRALQAAQESTTATLVPDLENSRDWDTTGNVFIEGDNLEVLKILQRHYHGKIKMIYIDPPYNTGKDFVYPDNYKEGLASYLEWTKQVNEEGKKVSTNSDTDGRYHSNWLSMMYPRLKLAKNLLTEDGVIFISIDDNEYENLKKICNEIFGENNHVATFVWKSKSGGANDSGEVAVDHEYILAFSRSIGSEILGTDPEGEVTTSYNYRDEKGAYALERLDKQNLGYQKSLDFPIQGPDGNVYKVQQRNPDLPNARWRWALDTVESRFDELVFKGGHVYTKNYESDGAKPRSLFVDERFGRTRTGSSELRDLLGGNFFDNPKPTKLLEILISIATKPDSIVLDFFAGSGSFGHAVLNVNQKDSGIRRTISVQLPEPTEEKSEARKSGFNLITEVTRLRLNQAADLIARRINNELVKESLPDVGFRAFRLAESNFPVWRASSGFSVSEVEKHVNEIAYFSADQNNAFDYLVEVLIKLGFSLSVSLTKIESDVFEAYSVGDGSLIAVVASKSVATLEDFSSLIELNPARLLVMEDAYAGSDELKTNLEQECNNREIELIKK